MFFMLYPKDRIMNKKTTLFQFDDERLSVKHLFKSEFNF